jgi:hypothetical protein
MVTVALKVHYSEVDNEFGAVHGYEIHGHNN